MENLSEADKKAPLLGGLEREEKYALIAKACNSVHSPSISEFCKLAKVSRNAFYEWLKRPIRITQDELQLLELFYEKKGRYGIRRLKMAYDRRFKTR